MPKNKLNYSAKAKKVIKADLVIKDVCENCNNGQLSELDSYFCELYDAYLGKPILPNQTIEFCYDYSLLTRALLKIAYNSSRTTNIDTNILCKYAQTIRTPDTTPIGIYVKAVTIFPVHFVKPTQSSPRLLSTMGATRCGPIMISDRDRSGLAARIIQINAYRFYVLACEDVSLWQDAVRYVANERGYRILPSGVTTIFEPTLSALRAIDGVQHWPVREHLDRSR